MSWKFNPPPGWPDQPAGWAPPPGWTPDPSWPPPPAGWQFWVAADQPTATPTSPYPTSPTSPYPTGPTSPYPTGPPSPYAGSPGYQAGPAQPGSSGKLWFAQWWGVLGLVGALIVGGLLGFGGTNLGLASSDDDPEPPVAIESPSPPPTESPGVALPTLPPIPTEPPGGDLNQVCGEVAVVMVVMVGEQMRAGDADDPRAALAESRRTAATSLREVDGGNDTEDDALATFADELDDAADYLEQGAFTERRLDQFLERSSGAWDDFNTSAGC